MRVEVHDFVESQSLSVPLSFALDKNITGRAIKVYLYLASCEDGSESSAEEISKAVGLGKDTVYKALRELYSTGWVEKTTLKDENGRYVGSFFEVYTPSSISNGE